MKISIIDIGTQSLKHYIFSVENSGKEIIHFKRYSDLSLGMGDMIPKEAFERASELLTACAALNIKEKVEKGKVLGTEALRRAKNAGEFSNMVEKILGVRPEIISQEKEALYLYQGFVKIVPAGQTFAAVNIGGGSTELVIGDSVRLSASYKLPLGVRTLKPKFTNALGEIDWSTFDSHLEKEIVVAETIDTLFVTGVLEFVRAVASPLHLAYTHDSLKNHPVRFSLDGFADYVQKLRNIKIPELKKIYSKDPAFCDNIAVGQSVYLAVAKKIGAQNIFPSNNDLTDGVIESLS